MKFAVAALLANTSAIQINNPHKEKGELACVSWKQADRIYEELDTNHNKVLSVEEVKVGVETLAHDLNHTITAEEWKWIGETGEKIDSKNPG